MIKTKIINPGEDYADALKVRYAVFVEEQGIPYEREIDDYDKSSYHAVIYNGYDGVPVACGRLYYEDNAAHIGRVAVLKEYRRKGYATAVCNKLIEIAGSADSGMNIETVILHSQTYAVQFYEKLGFKCAGEEFLDENIPHFEMRLKL